jgi:hypothetical protein
MFMFQFFKLSALLIALLALSASAADPQSPAPFATAGFSFHDTPGQYLDILLDGKIAARYMYTHDTSTEEKRVETYKPYLHIFDAEGKAPITKGTGGVFPHHRAIFIGFNKITYNGKTYDRWHMKGGEIVHDKFTTQTAGPNDATLTALINWSSDPGKPPLLVEERTFTFHRGPAPPRLTLDTTSVLSAPNGAVKLSPDPEHSGVQYRPAAELDTKKTIYVFPKEHADAHKDVDLPWVGETYSLHHNLYSIVEMNDPKNPKGIKYSAYRDYGRFGAFIPTTTIPAGQSLTLKFRFLITDGSMPPADMIEKSFDDFAGNTTPSPIPTLTTTPAETTAPAKPKTPGR